MRMRASERDREGTAWNSPRERTAEASSSPAGRSRVREVGACWDMVAVDGDGRQIDKVGREIDMRVESVTLMPDVSETQRSIGVSELRELEARDDHRRPRSGSRLLSHHTNPVLLLLDSLLTPSLCPSLP